MSAYTTLNKRNPIKMLNMQHRLQIPEQEDRTFDRCYRLAGEFFFFFFFLPAALLQQRQSPGTLLQSKKGTTKNYK